MSPIFNHHALKGLSNHALEHLRTVLRNALAAGDLSAAERANLQAALQGIEAILRTRQAAPRPIGPAPSI